ncbi:bacteriochlorophyll 4-vinyl reductase [Ferdinandcohnia sp. Marseille-Q9671]
MEKTVKPKLNFNTALEASLKIPGIRVERTTFLTKRFSERVSASTLEKIIEDGPYNAGISKKELDNIAKSLIQKRTLFSSSQSFAAGLPGGIAMVGTIPADMLQFFGTTLKLAQELAYLYGHKDLWLDEHLDTEKARDNLILYLGVMFGVSGSTSAIKFVSSGFANTIAKKLPQKALTKTIYYPIIKKVAAMIGIKVNKDIFAKGVSKIIPVVGGFVSGTITYSTMKPMGKRLSTALSESLDLSNEDIIKEYRNMKTEFPDIIDIDFEEIIDEEELN